MNLIQMSIYGAVMILVIAIVRAIALNRLPKKVFIILWSVVLIRLLIPFSIPSIFSAYSLIDVKEPVLETLEGMLGGDVLLQIEPSRIEVAEASGEAQEKSQASVWFGIWGVGVTACTAFFVIAYLRCWLEFRSSLPVQCEYISHWLKKHPLKRSVKVRQSDRITTPLTYGILAPVILLPRDTEWKNEERLQHILSHEYIHIRHFDMAVKLIAAAALCIHWFNPLVWMMYILFN